LATTDTLLKAIAAPAIIGYNKNPFMGYKTSAAIGIPIIYMLYNQLFSFVQCVDFYEYQSEA
jgi:hypothetical protein